jgi:hypothetical protein
VQLLNVEKSHVNQSQNINISIHKEMTMIKLTVDPTVLRELQQAFPTPANSATKALNKYVRVLTRLIREAKIHGRDNFDKLFNLYTIPVNTLRHKGPQIGAERKRLHDWLGEHNLALLKVEERGNNKTGRLSRVCLTSHCSLETQAAADTITPNMSCLTLLNHITQTYPMTPNELHEYFPELENNPNFYDHIPVDMESLANYIRWLKFESTIFKEESKAKQIEESEFILRVAAINGWQFPMLRKPSTYGRTYYRNINIQSVPKLMRQGILGECWEYDVRSSVIGWKLAWMERIAKGHCSTDTFRKEFNATLNYLEDKKDFLRAVHSDLKSRLGENLFKTVRAQDIKQAITAISFGARTTAVCWEYNKSGFAKQTAISGIFKNHGIAQTFLNSPTIRKFAQEQNLMDKCVVEVVNQEWPELVEHPMFKNAKRVNNSKLMAYLYQQSESMIMDEVVEYIKSKGHDVLARIHDALVIRRCLGFEVQHEIEMMIREEFDNKYWKLSETEIRGFAPYDRFEVAMKKLTSNNRLREQEILQELTSA